MKRGFRGLGAVVVLGGMLLVRPAAAQDTEGALQLGLSTFVLSHDSSTLTVELPGGDADTDISTTQWGLRDEVAGEIGYGITDSLVVGGFVQLGGSSTSEEPEGGDETESSEFELFLGPKLDFMFMPGQKVRPFVGALVGLTMLSQEVGDIETSATGFQLGARGGIRAFLTDSVSLDPALAFSWTTASGESEAGAASTDISLSGISVGVMLGLSGWL